MKSIRFRYTNWKGEEHIYQMMPESSLSFGDYANQGELTWLISGHVTHRDGEPRPGRRTFKLTGLRDVVLGE